MNFEINLIPWREIRRQNERRKNKKIILAVLIMSGFLCFITDGIVLKMNEIQEEFNQFIRNKIAVFNTKILLIKEIKKKETKLIQQILELQNLKNSRFLVIHLLDELTELIPEGLVLNRLQKKENKLLLEGFAKSNESLSLFVQKIKNNPWMKNPHLLKIKKDKKLSEQSQFTLFFIMEFKQKEYLIHV